MARTTINETQTDTYESEYKMPFLKRLMLYYPNHSAIQPKYVLYFMTK